MKRRFPMCNGFWPISVFGLLVLGATLWGCSKELSSAPPDESSQVLAVQEVDDNTGEIIIRPRGVKGMPTPRGAVAEVLAANTVQIRWTPPPGIYTVRVARNGCQLAPVSSAEGIYLDKCPKPTGVYAYEICYCKAGVSGPKVILPVAILDHSSPHSRDRGQFQDRVTDGIN